MKKLKPTHFGIAVLIMIIIFAVMGFAHMAKADVVALSGGSTSDPVPSTGGGGGGGSTLPPTPVDPVADSYYEYVNAGPFAGKSWWKNTSDDFGYMEFDWTIDKATVTGRGFDFTVPEDDPGRFFGSFRFEGYAGGGFPMQKSSHVGSDYGLPTMLLQQHNGYYVDYQGHLHISGLLNMWPARITQINPNLTLDPVGGGAPGHYWEMQMFFAGDFLPTKDMTAEEVGLSYLGVDVGSVPEPASLGLLALGGLMLVKRRRRRVKHAHASSSRPVCTCSGHCPDCPFRK